MTQRRIPRCLPLGGLAIMIAAALLLALWGAVQAASPQPPRHDIIVLLDNSGSMVRNYKVLNERDPLWRQHPNTETATPSDSAQHRIAFTKFLIRSMQQLDPDNTSVAVASFAASITKPQPISSPRQLSPLKPVQAWTAAEIESIHQQECLPSDAKDENGLSVVYSPTWDFCFGTNYRTALLWAQNELSSTVRCGSPTRYCDILIFSDGSFYERNSDTEKPGGMRDLEQTLKDLSVDGIKTSVVLFDVEKEDYRAKWRSWEEEQGWISPPVFYTNTGTIPATGVYADAIRLLGLKSLFDGFESKLVPKGGEQVMITVPPRTAYLEVELVPGLTAKDEYFASPGVVMTPTKRVGGTRLWIMPDFSRLEMRLTEPGMVYYRITSETLMSTVPLRVSLVVSPTRPLVGQSFDVQALVFDADGIMQDDKKLLIRAQINLGDTVIESGLDLKPQIEGIWVGHAEPLPAGNYSLTATVEPIGWVMERPAQIRSLALVIRDVIQKKIILDVHPPQPWNGEPVVFEASPVINGELAKLSQDTRLTLLIQPTTASPYELEESSDGVWRTSSTITFTSADSYVAKVEAPALWGFDSKPITFEVRSVPALAVVPVPTRAPAGAVVAVTVTVTTTEDSRPELWMQYGESDAPEAVFLDRWALGRYTGQFTMPETGDVTLMARLPGNTSSQYFQSLPAVVMLERPPIGPVASWWLRFWQRFYLLILGGLILTGILVAFLLWYRRPDHKLTRQLANPEKSSLVWRKMATWTVDQNWSQIKALGTYVSKWIDDNGELTKVPSDQSASFQGFEQNLRAGVEATRAALIYALAVHCGNLGAGESDSSILKVVYHRSYATSIYIQRGLVKEIIRRYQKEHKNTSFALDFWSKAAELVDSQFDSENSSSLVEALDEYMTWLADPRIPENNKERRLYLVLHHLHGMLKRIAAHSPIDFPVADGEYASDSDFNYAADNIQSMRLILQRAAQLAWPSNPDVEERIEQVRKDVEADIRAAMQGDPENKREGNPMEYYMLENLILRRWAQSPGD